MRATWFAAIAGLAVLTAAPADARKKEPPAPPPAPVIPQTHSGDAGIDAYYFYNRRGAPLWLSSDGGRQAAARLVEVLKRAPIDGLPNGPVLAASVEAAIAGGTLDDDARISSAWMSFVRALHAPVTGMSYADAERAPKAPTAKEALSALAAAPSMVAALDQTANVNSVYASLRDAALAQNLAADPRVKATLDYARMIPGTGRAVLVDIPSAQLLMFDNGQVVDTMKVIVGKKSGATPILASTIHYVTFNPYWHIPQDIARVRVAPVVVKRGVGYLTLARYQTVEAFGGDKEVQIDPLSVDWKAVVAGKAEVHVRQLAGPQNMMGRMKIGFANDYGVFLHDTPNKKLFAKDNRFLSHGCIRMEQPDKLAAWLLGREARPPSDDSELNVQLDKGVPVYLSYLTARPVDGGPIAFLDDVYGLETAGVEKAVMAASPSAD